MEFHRRLEHSSRKGSAYFVTWRLDQSGIVANAIRQGMRGSKYEPGAWILMANHIHIALRPLGDYDLASTVRDGSAREAIGVINQSGLRFWAKDYFDRGIRDRDHGARIKRYIGNNPIKAGLCASVQDSP